MIPNFFPIVQDKIFVCCEEVTAINRSAFFAPAISKVFIDVTSPFIVETSRLWDAFPSAFLSWSIMTILCDSCARSLDR